MFTNIQDIIIRNIVCHISQSYVNWIDDTNAMGNVVVICLEDLLETNRERSDMYVYGSDLQRTTS